MLYPKCDTNYNYHRKIRRRFRKIVNGVLAVLKYYLIYIKNKSKIQSKRKKGVLVVEKPQQSLAA